MSKVDKERLSVKETFLEMLKDFGSMAVGFVTLGRIKLEKSNNNQIDDIIDDYDWLDDTERDPEFDKYEINPRIHQHN